MELLNLIRLAYLRHDLNIKKKDTFLIGYPKSGNTWLRTILSNILAGEGNSVNQFTGLDYVINANSTFMKSPRGRFKHHNSSIPRIFSLHAQGTTLFPKVIYIYRDVRSVLVSYYNWEKMKKKDFKTSFDDYIKLDRQWPCRWDEHIMGWKNEERNIKILFLKYEDLLINTELWIRKILKFINLKASNSHIRQSISNSSFGKMKLAEEQNDFYLSTKANKNLNFIREGKIDGWNQVLKEEQKTYIEKKYSETLNLLGYLKV